MPDVREKGRTRPRLQGFCRAFSRDPPKHHAVGERAAAKTPRAVDPAGYLARCVEPGDRAAVCFDHTGSGVDLETAVAEMNKRPLKPVIKRRLLDFLREERSPKLRVRCARA